MTKAQNIGKAVDKKLGVEREVVGRGKAGAGMNKVKGFGVNTTKGGEATTEWDETKGNTELEGSYGGFQPKPAVEVIIVAMKPLSEKTFVDQALKNRKGITWLDSIRIPYESEGDLALQQNRFKGHKNPKSHSAKSLFTDIKDHSLNLVNPSGRFPANLLVSDDVLNDGRVTKSGKDAVRRQEGMFVEHHLGGEGNLQVYHPDSGSFSRYFDLEKWWEKKIKGLPESVQRTFPFAIISKASKSEKNRGCEGLPDKLPRAYRTEGNGTSDRPSKGMERFQGLPVKNTHPTVKPIKLMSYLITLGSREGDTVVDPFIGTGATAIACQILGRKCTGYEINANYCEIAKSRLAYYRQKAMNL
ncbi:hypothetical protein ES705_28313 [subsurface metagenome]